MALRTLKTPTIAETLIHQAILPLLVLCVFCAPAWGAPVFGKKMKFRQPDGTLIDVIVWGDEFYQHVESPDGYSLLRDPASGKICYAGLSADDRQLVSTGIVVSSKAPASMGLKRHLRAAPEVIRRQVNAAKSTYASAPGGSAQKPAGAEEPLPATTSTGVVQGICLIVDFPGEPGTIAPGTVSAFCNQIGYAGFGNNGSIRDYFHDVSQGRLTYTNYVPSGYYRAIHPKAYYDDPAVEYGVRARELVVEALTALDAQGFDFSQYDVDNNGQIDAINCFYVGTTSSGWAYGLWPHSSIVSFTADGVSAYRYQISDMGSSLELDVFCHENGHMLCGWPDLYDYDYDSTGVGSFCLMSNMASATNPVHPCAYLKYIAGWTDTTLLVNQQVGLPLAAGVNQVYKFEHPYLLNEYYLIENRQRAGRDQALPDAGLALWHIDTYGSNNFQHRTTSMHYKVTLVQADGRWDLESNINFGDSGDLWKSPLFTACGPESIPNTRWWDGTNSSLALSQIGPSGTNMTFTFGGASILLEPSGIVRHIYPGAALSNDTFTVSNGTAFLSMDYTVQPHDSWITVSPQTGSSGGEADTITITYDNSVVQTWTRGSYSVTISVNSPTAQNNPQYLNVMIIVGSLGPDLDFDMDVDQADFGLFQGCISGVNKPQTNPACARADFNKDGDVDRYDFEILMGCMSGPNVPADLLCDGFSP